MMFTVLEPTTDNILVCKVPNPRIDAYRYMAWLKQQGRNYRLIVDGDDCYIVESAGLETFRYERVVA